MHHLTHPERTPYRDTTLGLILATIAGALNAGGFLLVGQYTGHMSGVVSSLADNLALGAWPLLAPAGLAFAGFLTGSAVSALMVTLSRRHLPHTQYALPLALEGLLILAFSGLELTRILGLLSAITMLCFIMGLQNATITKASGARIRTTHLTGMTTDIGIELGKLVTRQTDYSKLRLLASLLGSFFLGGLLGAIGFHAFGAACALPLGLFLLVLTLPALLKPLSQ